MGLIDDAVRLWLSASVLGTIVASARIVSDWKTGKSITWLDSISSLLLSFSAGILTMLYLWGPLLERPTLLVFWSGILSWFGPDFPHISASVFRRFTKRWLLNGNGA